MISPREPAPYLPLSLFVSNDNFLICPPLLSPPSFLPPLIVPKQKLLSEFKMKKSLKLYIFCVWCLFGWTNWAFVHTSSTKHLKCCLKGMRRFVEYSATCNNNWSRVQFVFRSLVASENDYWSHCAALLQRTLDHLWHGAHLCTSISC